MMHSHIQKIRYLWFVKFKTDKTDLYGNHILHKICRHKVLNYTYHKPQIIRDTSRIILCPKTLEEILEIEKNDGSCCHWCWSQTKLQCLHIINHRPWALPLSPSPKSEVMDVRWISTMSRGGLSGTEWKRLRTRQTTSQRAAGSRI